MSDNYSSLHLTPTGWKPCRARLRRCRYKTHQDALIAETHALEAKREAIRLALQESSESK